MFQVYYMITNECNLKCVHCIRGDTFLCSSMNLVGAIEGLKRISEWNDRTMLVLSGGEPTLHHNFYEILRYALSRFKKVVVNTNGTTNFFVGNIQDFCVYKNLVVQVSIDGTQEYHDAIRGVGNYIKSVTLVSKLLKAGYRVAVSTTVNRDNYYSIPKLCEELNNLHICKWHVSPEMPIGRAELNNMLPMVYWNDLVEKLIDRARIMLSVRKLFDFCRMDTYSDEKLDELTKRCICNCGTGRMKIYVDSNFNIKPCTCLPIVCGNILKDSLNDIFDSEEMRKIRNHKVKESTICSKCRYKNICNGGCFGMSQIIFGDIGYGDIRCEKVRKYFDEKKGVLF